MTYFLTTQRLGFRHWSPDDLPLALELWGDDEVTRWIGGPFSREQVEARLARECASPELQYWPIFRLEDDAFAGCCGLRAYQPRIHELGFHLCRAHWGRGYASEAARAAIAWGFDTLGAEALFAGHHPSNDASRALLAKLGFEYTHDEHYGPTGLMHPSYLLRSPRSRD